MRYQEKDPHKLFISFSVYRNGEKLFDITKTKSKSSIDCLNGLRGISLMFIIFGHRTFNQISASMANGSEFNEWMETPISAVLASFHIWVDTFFVMGGLLVTWSFLNALDK
jgi:peptidoglycan/LPS O-acetylase OafA/YrhL